MKYMGSKNRIAKNLIEIMFNKKHDYSYYIEPFCGGCNVIDKVPGRIPRLANDSNRYLVEMLNSLLNGWKPPEHVSREFYDFAYKNKHVLHPELVGWIGINCSYSGKWFGGYAGLTKTKTGYRDYQAEAIRNVMKQIKNLTGVTFVNMDYKQLQIPENSIVYCDPPYENTTGYKDKFNHKAFWAWCNNLPVSCQVYVSEYQAPNNFTCVYEKPVRSSLSANGRYGKSKQSVEKLFLRMI